MQELIWGRRFSSGEFSKSSKSAESRPKYATPAAVPSSLKYRTSLSLQGRIYKEGSD
jgi:hypothetical protein